MFNFTDKITNRLIIETKNKSDPEVLNYGLFLIIHNFIGYSIICLFAYFLNILLETIVITITSSILRMFSGGVHASTPIKCTILGTIIFLILAKISNLLINLNYIVLIIISVTVFSMLIINKYSFSLVHNKSLNEFKHGKKLKKMILLIIGILAFFLIFLETNYQNFRLVNQLIVSYCIGTLWHSFTLLPMGQKLFTDLDFLLNKIIKL